MANAGAVFARPLFSCVPAPAPQQWPQLCGRRSSRWSGDAQGGVGVCSWTIPSQAVAVPQAVGPETGHIHPAQARAALHRWTSLPIWARCLQTDCVRFVPRCPSIDVAPSSSVRRQQQPLWHRAAVASVSERTPGKWPVGHLSWSPWKGLWVGETIENRTPLRGFLQNWSRTKVPSWAPGQ